MNIVKAKSIKIFCNDYKISRATFYRNSKLMPRTVLIGHQRRILVTDEVDWLEMIRKQSIDQSSINEIESKEKIL